MKVSPEAVEGIIFYFEKHTIIPLNLVKII